jgi:hypothetical protein
MDESYGPQSSLGGENDAACAAGYGGPESGWRIASGWEGRYTTLLGQSHPFLGTSDKIIRSDAVRPLDSRSDLCGVARRTKVFPEYLILPIK